MLRANGNIVTRVRRGMHRRLVPSPVSARHMEYSMLYSEDDSASKPTTRLIELSVEAINRAHRNVCLAEVSKRLAGRFPYSDDTIALWPGEHYTLLAAFVQALHPKLVIEIGTAEGISALSILKYLPHDANLVTFDLIPWDTYPNACL